MDQIDIDSVVINRDRRIRKEVTPAAIEGLAESISRLGYLINPITITKEQVLIAGETRLLACRSLGWTHIPFRFFEDLSESAHLAIELEENIKRTDLPWKDQCDALLRFHELQRLEHGNWTQEDTAKAIGLKRQTVAEQLQVAREVAQGNSRVADAPKYSQARRITGVSVQRREADQRNLIAAAEGVPLPPKKATPIEVGNFLEWAPAYNAPPFNFIHCDFPYGIESHKGIEHKQYASHSLGTYDDSKSNADALRLALKENIGRLLGDSGHIIFWFSMHQYVECLEYLKSFCSWVDPFPLIWDKGNIGIIPNPEMGPRRSYETAFLASFGGRKILQPVSNIYKANVEREAGHTSEKSVDMLTYFFRMFVDEKTRMLDPTCGSGSALRAARNLNCGHMVGLEVNPAYAEAARKAWTDGL